MDINEQKDVVARFLLRCNAYADDMLAGYARKLAAAEHDGLADEAGAIRTKRGQWQSYKAFNEHALAELATDRLDDWFEGTPGS